MSDPGLLSAAVAAAADDPSVPGLDAVVEVVVTGPAKQERRAGLIWRDGRLVETTVGPPEHADLSVTVAADDGRAILDGAMAPTVAFMRGRLKTAGDPGLVLRLLAATDRGAWARWVAAAAGTAAS